MRSPNTLLVLAFLSLNFSGLYFAPKLMERETYPLGLLLPAHFRTPSARDLNPHHITFLSQVLNVILVPGTHGSLSFSSSASLQHVFCLPCPAMSKFSWAPGFPPTLQSYSVSFSSLSVKCKASSSFCHLYLLSVFSPLLISSTLHPASTTTSV